MKVGVNSEKGSVLVSVLAVATIIAIGLASMLAAILNQQRSIARSLAWNEALPLVEAGIEEALSHLQNTGGDNMSSDGWALIGDRLTKTRELDSPRTYYHVEIAEDASFIESEGFVQLPLSDSFVSRKVRVTVQAPDGDTFGIAGLIATGKVTISGGIYADSYDSSNGAHSTNGQYDPSKSGENGVIGTTSRAKDSLEITGGQIVGPIYSGPPENEPVLKMGGGASVGSKEWVDGGNSGVQPGWYKDDLNIDVPEVDVPFTDGYSWLGDSFNEGTVDEEWYKYRLTDGKYKLTNLTLNGDDMLAAVGEVELWIEDTVNVSGNGKILVDQGATLKIYVGQSATFSGGGVVNKPNVPAAFQFFGFPSNEQIDFTGNSKVVATVYAPNAKLDLSGNNDFMGAAVVGELTLGGGFRFHFDEALGGGGAGKDLAFVATSWLEL